MSRSLTLPVPSGRQVLLAVVGVLVAFSVLILGVRLGASLLSPSPVMGLAAEGGLHQIHVLGGAVYLGTIVGEDADTLRLARPAIVRQEQAPVASAGESGPRTIVQGLGTDPYGIATDILIPLRQVTLIGVVLPASSLAVAYGEAMGQAPTPAGSPSP